MGILLIILRIAAGKEEAYLRLLNLDKISDVFSVKQPCITEVL